MELHSMPAVPWGRPARALRQRATAVPTEGPTAPRGVPRDVAPAHLRELPLETSENDRLKASPFRSAVARICAIGGKGCSTGPLCIAGSRWASQITPARGISHSSDEPRVCVWRSRRLPWRNRRTRMRCPAFTPSFYLYLVPIVGSLVPRAGACRRRSLRGDRQTEAD